MKNEKGDKILSHFCFELLLHKIKLTRIINQTVASQISHPTSSISDLPHNSMPIFFIKIEAFILWQMPLFNL